MSIEESLKIRAQDIAFAHGIVEALRDDAIDTLADKVANAGIFPPREFFQGVDAVGIQIEVRTDFHNEFSGPS